MGAAKGNRNATKHGIAAFVLTDNLPAGAEYIRRGAIAMRRAIEDEVSLRHGRVTLEHSTYIQSATRYECIAQLCLRYLDVEPGLTVPEKLAILKELRTATMARDGAIKALKLSAEGLKPTLETAFAEAREAVDADQTV